MLKEFKQFVLRGNVIDLAVGVIVGAAFNKIVSSFIEDVITPLLLKPALDAAGITELSKLTVFGTVKYGNFLSAIISFLIVAFVLFLIVKAANAAKRREEVKPPPVAEVPADIKLLSEIRDLLKKQ
jgi:large conductance mechanosensitive channel